MGFKYLKFLLLLIILFSLICCYNKRPDQNPIKNPEPAKKKTEEISKEKEITIPQSFGGGSSTNTLGLPGLNTGGLTGVSPNTVPTAVPTKDNNFDAGNCLSCAYNQMYDPKSGKCVSKSNSSCINQPQYQEAPYYVCGCNGKTYLNSCYATKGDQWAGGVSKWVKGYCLPFNPVSCKVCQKGYYFDKNTGICERNKMILCNDVIKPVCGCNRVTYDNFCYATIGIPSKKFAQPEPNKYNYAKSHGGISSWAEGACGK